MAKCPESNRIVEKEVFSRCTLIFSPPARDSWGFLFLTQKFGAKHPETVRIVEKDLFSRCTLIFITPARDSWGFLFAGFTQIAQKTG
ncbi:hypothetical protein [Microseira sp. BLCC-F43]|uniref:hypothetical protein n=1 Tax=Microseira sp. BLCC-F43 TaxID=3153602 RepID=UPI0035BBC976